MIRTMAPTDMPTAMAMIEPLFLEWLGAGELTGNASSEEAAVGFAVINEVADDENELRDAIASSADDLDGSEDVDKWIDFAVPGFDPMENRLMAPASGQQLLLNSPEKVEKMLQHINPPSPAH